MIIDPRSRTLGVVFVAVVTLACLAPFVGKAFHIDDPLFIWSARRIHENPLDFYGFSGNWLGQETPMAEAIRNPPGTSYYMALAALLFGWSEVALHLAFLLPALAVAVGIHSLARRLCGRPVLAALAGVLTPLFILSGTTVMCDVTMLAFWVWAVHFWLRGVDEDRSGFLFVSSLLVAACVVTKYFGVALIPLLLAYSGFKNRRFRVHDFFLLIPVAILSGYQALTIELYGRGLLTDAMVYAEDFGHFGGGGRFSNILVGLAFAGGCAATGLFFLPLLWSRGKLVLFGLLFALFLFLLPLLDGNGSFVPKIDGVTRWGYVIQFSLYAVAGVGLMAIAAADFFARRNAPSLLLLLWVAGTLVFSCLFNWTVNGRSLLPVVPALGILLARRIDEREKEGPKRAFPALAVPLAASALLGLFAAWADYRFAGSARDVAAEIRDTCGDSVDTVWFQGQWGFQYYMEEAGCRVVDVKRTQIRPGDVLAVQMTNTNEFDPRGKGIRHLRTITRTPCAWMTTMNPSAGAGFYTEQWGALPFRLGPAPPDEYHLFEAGFPRPRADAFRK
jgi:4-amino-4-deoxy-L-arabinose transferase-like glycosyltransferase